MDLCAFVNFNYNDEVKKYITEIYGEIPRCRGVRFMKVEKPVENTDNDSEIEMFNEYAGEDVIYIHTRCGDCGMGYDDEDSNYVYCGAKDWEEEHKDLFLDHVTEEYDRTYCTHYFRAVVNDDYNKIVGFMTNSCDKEE